MTGRRCILAIVLWVFLEAAIIALILCTDCSGQHYDRPDTNVLRIEFREGGGISGWGTGTIVNRGDGIAYVLTCWHLSRDGGHPFVYVGNQPYPAEIILTDHLQDLALLRIRDPGIRPAIVAETEPRIGETIWLAGYGSGAYRKTGGPVTQFVIPGLPDGRSGVKATFVDCRLLSRDGDSGGPMINRQGQLVGVVCGNVEGNSCGACLPRLRGFMGRCFARPAAPVRRPLVEVPPPIVRIPPSQAGRIPSSSTGTYPVQPAERIPQVDPPPPPDRTSDPETLAAIAQLRAEVAELRTALKALPPGPPGRPGKDGRDGIDGKNAGPVTYDIVPRQ